MHRSLKFAAFLLAASVWGITPARADFLYVSRTNGTI
jgi:sugar lactone lactonase YvrE